MDTIEKNFSRHFSSEEKKVAMALWKAKVPLKTVREQCKISEDQRIKEIKRLWIIKMDYYKYLKKLMVSMPRKLEKVIAKRVPPLSTEIPENRKQWKIKCFFLFFCIFYVFFYTTVQFLGRHL
jgi:hypothetical protein